MIDFETQKAFLRCSYGGKRHERRIYSEKELLDLAEHEALLCGKTFYEEMTPRELLDNFLGVKKLEDISLEDVQDEPWIFFYGLKYGWDTNLYRADFIARDELIYSPEKIDIHDAAIAALTHDTGEIFIEESKTDSCENATYSK